MFWTLSLTSFSLVVSTAVSAVFSLAQAQTSTLTQSMLTVRVQTPEGIKPMNVSFPTRSGIAEIRAAYSLDHPKMAQLVPEQDLLIESRMDSLLTTDSEKLIVRAIRMLSELIHFRGDDLDMAKVAAVQYSVEPDLQRRSGGYRYFPAVGTGPNATSDFEAAVAKKFELPFDARELSTNPRFTPERFDRVSASKVKIVFATTKGEVSATLIVYLEDSYLPFVSDQRSKSAETFDSRIYGLAQVVHTRAFIDPDAPGSIQTYLPSGVKMDVQGSYRFAIATKSASSDLPTLYKNVLNIPQPPRLGFESPIKAKDPLYNFIKLNKQFFDVPDGRSFYQIWK